MLLEFNKNTVVSPLSSTSLTFACQCLGRVKFHLGITFAMWSHPGLLILNLTHDQLMC